VLFLIDGYNLMYAEAFLGKTTPRKALEKKRLAFLDWLAQSLMSRPEDVLVIFDAKHAVGPSEESSHKGIRVRFAYRQLADDLIESLVKSELKPASVTVVSNDGQVKDAARRRGCGVFTNDDFGDWLAARRETPKVKDTPAEKPSGPTPGEEEELLKAFAVPRPKRRGK